MASIKYCSVTKQEELQQIYLFVTDFERYITALANYNVALII